MADTEMKVVELPIGNVADVPAQLRHLADAIERGAYGDAHNVAWVCDTGQGVEVGLCGKASSPGPKPISCSPSRSGSWKTGLPKPQVPVTKAFFVVR